MSIVVDIAKALVTELNAQTFDPSFTAKRAYRPVFELKDMATLQVTVVPRSREIQSGTRSVSQQDVQVDIAIQKRLGREAETDPTETDGLMDLADQIIAYLRSRKLAGVSGAVWVRTEHQPIYSVEHLERFRGFTSVLTVTYRVLQ